MRIQASVFVASLGLMAASVPLLAHHSFAAEYDSNKPIKISGVVTKVGMDEPPCAVLCGREGRGRQAY